MGGRSAPLSALVLLTSRPGDLLAWRAAPPPGAVHLGVRPSPQRTSFFSRLSIAHLTRVRLGRSPPHQTGRFRDAGASLHSSRNSALRPVGRPTARRGWRRGRKPKSGLGSRQRRFALASSMATRRGRLLGSFAKLASVGVGSRGSQPNAKIARSPEVSRSSSPRCPHHPHPLHPPCCPRGMSSTCKPREARQNRQSVAGPSHHTLRRSRHWHIPAFEPRQQTERMACS